MRALFPATAAFLAIFLGLAGVAGCQEVGDKALNDQIRAQLAAEHDDGTAPRPVDHWAYPNPSTRAAKYDDVATLLKGLGFAVEPAAADGGIKFSKTTVLADAAFDDLTKKLVVVLAKQGWSYDGWETVVVRNGGST